MGCYGNASNNLLDLWILATCNAARNHHHDCGHIFPHGSRQPNSSPFDASLGSGLNLQATYKLINPKFTPLDRVLCVAISVENKKLNDRICAVETTTTTQDLVTVLQKQLWDQIKTQTHMQLMRENETWKKQRECNIPSKFVQNFFIMHIRKQPTRVQNRRRVQIINLSVQILLAAKLSRIASHAANSYEDKESFGWRWKQEKVGFLVNDFWTHPPSMTIFIQLFVRKCHLNNYHYSDIKCHMTLNIIFSVAFVHYPTLWIWLGWVYIRLCDLNQGWSVSHSRHLLHLSPSSSKKYLLPFQCSFPLVVFRSPKYIILMTWSNLGYLKCFVYHVCLNVPCTKEINPCVKLKQQVPSLS